MQNIRVTTDCNNGAVTVSVRTQGPRDGLTVEMEASFHGRAAGGCSAQICGEYTTAAFTVEDPQLWTAGVPNLYDIVYRLKKDGRVIDTVTGYFGIRTIELKDGAVCINNKPVFQRLVLDQGFYPDGIYTAPTDQDLKRDIELAMATGFNGARLHQKVFEERFLYWADHLGYLVWGEHASWGLDITTADGISCFLPEWLEILERDYSHPAIVVWCPFNETWDNRGRRQDDNVLKTVYLATKAADHTRPVIDTSGFYHVITDIYDIHDYEQSTAVFQERYRNLTAGGYYDARSDRQRYGGQPYCVSEYGGTRWPVQDKGGWGYGKAPKSEQEAAQRICGLTETLLDCAGVCAFCYTQLYDIEQEQNGLYTYDRAPKFTAETYDRFRAVCAKQAAIEKKGR